VQSKGRDEGRGGARTPRPGSAAESKEGGEGKVIIIMG